MTLVEIRPRVTATVTDILGGRRVRNHLHGLGIHVGDAITVVERAPFRGPVIVEIHGSRVALGRGVVTKVSVEPNASDSGRAAQ